VAFVFRMIDPCLQDFPTHYQGLFQAVLGFWISWRKTRDAKKLVAFKYHKFRIGSLVCDLFFFPQTTITSINSKQLGVFVVDLPKVVGTFEKESNKKLSPHGGALKKGDEFYGIESIKESHLMATNKSKLRGEFKTRKLYRKGPTETTYPFF